MSTIQVADATFVAAAPSVVAAELNRSENWRSWFGDLQLQVTEDRGVVGLRWAVAGSLSGTSEVWIQPHLDGSMVHVFLHAEPSAPMTPAQIASETSARRERGRDAVFALKWAAEAGRVLGGPAIAGEARR